MQNNELQLVVEQTGLEKSKVETVLNSFGKNFQEAKVTVEKAKSISVTSEDQKEEMLEARKIRLQLKDIRVNVENTRKELKEQSLREGKAIDGAANIIKALIIPVEEYLENQEKFAEIQETKRKAERLAQRIELLSPFVEDISFYSLNDISDEAFKKLLDDSKKAFEAQKEAEKKAEQERIEQEKKEEKKRQRIKKENEKLKKEAEERERQLAKEREAREKAEDEIKAKKEAEEKAAKEEDEKKKNEELEKLKAEKEARLAPDKEKMRVVYKNIQTITDNIHSLTFASDEARKVAGQTIIELQQVMLNMAERMKKV
jgi:hypothetical protein